MLQPRTCPGKHTLYWPALLLDYRCHAPRGRIGHAFPPRTRACLAELARAASSEPALVNASASLGVPLRVKCQQRAVNSGPARNAGADLCGDQEFVSFLDADDLMLPYGLAPQQSQSGCGAPRLRAVLLQIRWRALKHSVAASLRVESLLAL